MVRLYADEHFPRQVVQNLRYEGHDVNSGCIGMIKPLQRQRAQSLQKREMNNSDANGFDMMS
ncbi:MAG: hypothetical protein U7126_14010 [Microcoleus sp.]